MQYSIPIILMSQKLSEAGVHLDTPITKNLHGISLRSALHLMLKDLELTFIVRDEALIITTPEDAEAHEVVIAYPVRDLVDASGPIDWDPFVDLITTSVAPHRWQDWSGPGPQLGFGDGWLIFSQTSEVHDEVADFLAKLRRALAPAESSGESALTPVEKAEQAIAAPLDRYIDLAFRNMPLKDAVDRLQHELKIPIILAAKKLEEAGVNPDARVTAPPGRAAQQLQSMLEPLKLTYVIRDEVLQITTPEDAESQLVTRVYDVRPLLGSFEPPESLGKLIESRVAPGFWNSTGGPGSVLEFRGLLVVRQTFENHREVARLLNTLGTGTKESSPAEDKR
jgi:hypothetical protein